jgi:outer membrane scaffolding protein for murein synthesis (MipA/OmpV family)
MTPRRHACAVCIWMMLFVPARAEDQAKTSSSDWDITLGAGAAYRPRFESGKRYRAFAVPNVDITWRDTVFLSTEDGFGVNALQFGDFSAGPYLQWSDGRNQRVSQRLNGLGDVEGVLQGGLFARYGDDDRWQIFAKIWEDLSHDRSGTTVEVGGSLTLPLSTRMALRLRATGSWSDADALRPFYGVSAAQSARSGLPIFNAESGFRDFTFEPSLNYALDAHWSLSAIGGYRRLLSAVSESPLVRNGGDADQFSVGLLLNYHF